MRPHHVAASRRSHWIGKCSVALCCLGVGVIPSFAQELPTKPVPAEVTRPKTPPAPVDDLTPRTTKTEVGSQPGKPSVKPMPVDIGWDLREKDRRVWIEDVRPSTIAADAGFRKGDLITHVEKTAITSAAAVEYRLSLLRPGTTASISIDRAGSAMTLSMRLPDAPPEVVQQQKVPVVTEKTTIIVAKKPEAVRAELVRRLAFQEEVLKETLAEIEAIRLELQNLP